MRNEDKKFYTQLTFFQFLWAYLKYKIKYLVIFLIVAILWSVEVFLNPYLLKVIIDTVTQIPSDSAQLIPALLIPAILYCCISLVSNINFRLNDYACLKLYPRLKAEITKDMYSYLIKHSYSFFQSRFSGSLAKKIFDMTNNVELILRLIAESFVPALSVVIISCIMLLMLVHYMFALILITWAIFFVALSYLALIKLARYSQELSQFNTETSGKISESISTITTLKLFGAHYHETQSICSGLEHLVKADSKMHLQNLKINFVQSLGVTILTGLMITTLIYGYLQKWVTVGDFVLVLTVSISILASIYNIGRQLQQFAKMIGICKQSLSIIHEEHEIVDIKNATKIKFRNGGVEFKNVKFNYSHNKPVFDNLNIKLHPGQKIGLVGGSGEGKSTFIKLILRLIEPQSGSVLIDNQDIKMITMDSLIKHLTVIPQNPEMLHRSIMDNIKFAKPSATKREVISAAKKAKCHKFICELHKGYNTIIGERGTKLSGGQIQRLALARAFLKNSSILLLDEPTSALDSLTENDIQQSLQELMKNKTTIVIAHRLTTLQNLERILVFNQGKIVEDADFNTLVSKKDGLFFKFWQMQVGGFISAKSNITNN